MRLNKKFLMIGFLVLLGVLLVACQREKQKIVCFGDSVTEGESLLTIHSNQENVDQVIEKLYESITITTEHIEAPTLIYQSITD